MYWVKYVRFNGKRYKSCVRFFHRRSNAIAFADKVSSNYMEKYYIPGY